jgi:hypothetical protein
MASSKAGRPGIVSKLQESLIEAHYTEDQLLIYFVETALHQAEKTFTNANPGASDSADYGRLNPSHSSEKRAANRNKSTGEMLGRPDPFPQRDWVK